MKKIIQTLVILILLFILGLIIVFVFNPYGTRDQIMSNVLNSFLSSTLDDYQAPETENRVPYEASSYNHPLIPDNQEKALYEMGVDVSQLPEEITPAMQECFVEKLGQARAMEIVNGATPNAMDFFKAKDCLNK